MIIVTASELEQLRSALSDDPEAVAALDAIEDCEGDLEDAAIVLALHARQEPNTSERWIEGLAKRCRTVICQSDLKEQLIQENWGAAVEALKAAKLCPPTLVIPVLIFVSKQGVPEFCQVLDPPSSNFSGS